MTNEEIIVELLAGNQSVADEILMKLTASDRALNAVDKLRTAFRYAESGDFGALNIIKGILEEL